MANCEMLEGCVFFNDKMQNMPAIAGMYKKRLCQGDKTQCARYMVCTALGRSAVPLDLYPNQVDRAKTIISNAQG